MIGDIVRHLTDLGRLRRLWAGLFILKLAFGLLLVLPFYLTVNSVLSTSVYSRALTESWSPGIVLELFGGRGELIPMYLAVIFFTALFYLAVMQYVNGGLYYLMISGRYHEIDWREFFAECGVCFGMHLKITMLMIPVYILLFVAGLFFVNIISLAGGDIIGTPVLIMNGLKIVILCLIMLAVSVFSDSARASAAAYPEKSFRAVLSTAADYFRPVFTRMAVVFVITYLPFLIIWLVTETLAWKVIGLGWGMVGVVFEFILFQLSAVARSGQKLWYLSVFGRDFRGKNQGRFLPQQTEMSFE